MGLQDFFCWKFCQQEWCALCTWCEHSHLLCGALGVLVQQSVTVTSLYSVLCCVVCAGTHSQPWPGGCGETWRKPPTGPMHYYILGAPPLGLVQVWTSTQPLCRLTAWWPALADFSLRVIHQSFFFFCQTQSEAHGPPSAMASRKTDCSNINICNCSLWFTQILC